MTRLLLPALLLAATAAAPGHAQYYDPGAAQPQDRAMPNYSDDESGYTYGYRAGSDDARPGYAPPARPAPPGTNGGYRNDGGYAGYGQGYGPDGYGQPGYGGPGDDGQDGPGGPDGYDGPPPRRAPAAASRPYADRIARWRARADACEAGDLKACRGAD